MELHEIAAQLKKPEGQTGVEVGMRMNERNRYINEYTIEELDPQTSDTILEIGMGNGYFVKDILGKNSSINYVGTDYSGTMVVEATKNNQKYIDIGQAQFILSTARDLPFPDDSFSKVFTINTIYFWENPEEELKEIKRVLKIGGRVLIAIRPKSEMNNLPFVKFGFILYEKGDIVKLLEEAGFSNIKSTEKSEPKYNIDEDVISLNTIIISGNK